MNEPAISLEGVEKSFGRKHVLRGVTGSIDQGKVIGLLGRNGEGKTTLFRLMLDILSRDAGHISILGMTPDGSGKIRRMVGYIPERPFFHEFMRVEEVLRLRAGFFSAWNRTKAGGMVKNLQLDLKTRIRDASKGTLAKTAWICATAHNPKVLLMDEPTSGLDAVIRDLVLSQIVHELNEEGKTILLTNHHMEEMLGVLDEVWILSGGVIETRYSLEELRRHSFRITGRLKNGNPQLDALSILEDKKIGDLVQWLVIDKETIFRIQHMQILDNMQMEPLPLETSFKLLLSKTVEPPC